MIETKRLILRPWEDRDAEILYKYAKDEEVGPIAGWPPHKDVEESLFVIRNIFDGKECYALCLKDNFPIGCIELLLKEKSHLSLNDDECELGCWIGRPFWRQGYIFEASQKILDRAFYDLGIKRVFATYSEGNFRSKGLQEKLGFSFVETLGSEYSNNMGEKVRLRQLNVLEKATWERRKL